MRASNGKCAGRHDQVILNRKGRVGTGTAYVRVMRLPYSISNLSGDKALVMVQSYMVYA